jgi:cytochrome P450
MTRQEQYSVMALEPVRTALTNGKRRLLQPAFSRDRLALYATEMSQLLDAALGTWHDEQVTMSSPR